MLQWHKPVSGYVDCFASQFFFAMFYLAQLAWVPNAQTFSELQAPFQSWHLTIFSLWIASQSEQCSQFLINLLLMSLALKKRMHAGLQLTRVLWAARAHVASFQCKIGLNLNNVAPCLLLLFTAPRILFIPSHIPQGIPHLLFLLHCLPLLPPPSQLPCPTVTIPNFFSSVSLLPPC